MNRGEERGVSPFILLPIYQLPPKPGTCHNSRGGNSGFPLPGLARRDGHRGVSPLARLSPCPLPRGPGNPRSRLSLGWHLRPRVWTPGSALWLARGYVRGDGWLGLAVPGDGQQRHGGQREGGWLQRLGDSQPPPAMVHLLGASAGRGECEDPKVPGESGLGDLCFECGHLLPTKSPVEVGAMVWTLGL